MPSGVTTADGIVFTKVIPSVPTTAAGAPSFAVATRSDSGGGILWGLQYGTLRFGDCVFSGRSRLSSSLDTYSSDVSVLDGFLFFFFFPRPEPWKCRDPFIGIGIIKIELLWDGNSYHGKTICYWMAAGVFSLWGSHWLPLTQWGQDENDYHFANSIFKCIFLNENFLILNNISLKYVTWGLINNIATLVQIIAWHPTCDKPLSEALFVCCTDTYIHHLASIS